jgi:hypothetical protein
MSGPNAGGEPRQQPQRGTSEGCWRRLQCLVRCGPGEPYCSPPRPHGSWDVTRGANLRRFHVCIVYCVLVSPGSSLTLCSPT